MSNDFLDIRVDDSTKLHLTKNPAGFVVEIEEGLHWAALTITDDMATQLATWLMQHSKKEA